MKRKELIEKAEEFEKLKRDIKSEFKYIDDDSSLKIKELNNILHNITKKCSGENKEILHDIIDYLRLMQDTHNTISKNYVNTLLENIILILDKKIKNIYKETGEIEVKIETKINFWIISDKIKKFIIDIKGSIITIIISIVFIGYIFGFGKNIEKAVNQISNLTGINIFKKGE